MSVNLTGKGTGLARKLYIFLSIYLSIFFTGKANPMQHIPLHVAPNATHVQPLQFVE